MDAKHAPFELIKLWIMEANKTFQKRQAIRIMHTKHDAPRANQCDEVDTFKCSEKVCWIGAGPSARGGEASMDGKRYERSQDTLMGTVNRIMAEPYPCGSCAEAKACQMECKRFKRYCASKGDESKWQV